MSAQQDILGYFRQSREALQRAEQDAALHDTIAAIADRIADALLVGGKLLLAGNGGSAADAQHIAGELLSRFRFDRNPLPAIALTTDTSVLTAIGNDYGYEQVFERQVRGLGSKGARPTSSPRLRPRASAASPPSASPARAAWRCNPIATCCWSPPPTRRR
jgi:D-sedoheptulose 7-phosphate isomerase